MSINFQHAAVQNVPYLTTQPHCKIQLRCKNAFVLADGAKFRFKFICRYSANLFMRAVTQISFKILRRRACKHSLAKHTANAVALRNMPDKTPRAKQLSVEQLATQRFLACAVRALALQISRCKQQPQYSAHRPSKHEIFLPMYSRGKPSLQQLLPLAQSQDVSYRRCAI